ncbi:ArgE/DapE family deacylase [Candidatus Bathyarchaeota archaeon]|nr:ArgE/DapE family deacylase [Candidatus Bathyarchaeota archaeon]
MNDTERMVLDHIDVEGMMRFIESLVSTPSYGGKETAAQKVVAMKLRDLSFTVDTWMIDYDELRRHPDYSMSIPRDEGMGVVGAWGEGEASLMLCGHIDTVAPGERGNWDTPPLEATARDGRLYGRGVADMKAGLACGVYAVKALMDAGVKPRGRVLLASVIGEEDGGCGALATSLRYSADAGVIMEPTEVKIAPEIAGAMSFTVAVPGRGVHACVREEGVSAVEKFIVLFDGLKELERERNDGVDDPLYRRYRTPYALNVGTVEGGDWPGTVPERVEFKARLGVKVGESKEEARRQLEAKIDEIADGDPWLRENRPTVTWDGYSFASSMVPVDHPVVEALAGSYRDVTGEEPVYEGMTYASDARLLINVGGIPTVVFGPGDVRVAHGANESVSVDELRTVVETLALTVLRFLGG